MTKAELKRVLALVVTVFFFAGMMLGIVIDSVVIDKIFPPKVMVTETYTVKKGDTFWTIAEEYRELDCRNPYILQYMEELRDANPYLRENHSQVCEGDELAITYYKKEQQ